MELFADLPKGCGCKERHLPEGSRWPPQKHSLVAQEAVDRRGTHFTEPSWEGFKAVLGALVWGAPFI